MVKVAEAILAQVTQLLVTSPETPVEIWPDVPL